MENYVMVDEKYVRGLEARVKELEGQLAAEVERNLNNVSNYQLQVEDLREDLKTVKGHAKKFADELFDLRADNMKLRLCIKVNVDRYMRGGSWGLLHVNARTVYRGLNNPDFRYCYLGFRVVK